MTQRSDRKSLFVRHRYAPGTAGWRILFIRNSIVEQGDFVNETGLFHPPAGVLVLWTQTLYPGKPGQDASLLDHTLDKLHQGRVSGSRLYVVG
jgi:hypothetical protein